MTISERGLTDAMVGNQYDREAYKAMGHTVSMFAGPAVEIIRNAGAVAYFVLTWLTLPVEVIVRKDFGIRYATWARYIAAGFIAGAVKMLLGLFFLLFSLPPVGALTWIWGWIVFFFFVWNWRNSRLKFKQGIRWHSMSQGISRFMWIGDRARQWNIPYLRNMDDWFMARVVDPGYILVLGLFTRVIDQNLGWFLLLSGFALLVQNNMRYGFYWNRVLDIMDAEIESANYQLSAAGAPKQETAGFQVVRVPAIYREEQDLALMGGVVRRNDSSNGQGLAGDFAGTLEETLNARK